MWDIAGGLVGLGAGALAARAALRARNLDAWLGSYLSSWGQRGPVHLTERPVHVFFCVCDHYEPEWGRPGHLTALGRVERWRIEYPRLFGDLTDARGRPPQHTFFFPADEYRPEYLELLADLCQEGYGDVDIHLHHDNDTPEGLRQTLEDFRTVLHERHGLLREDPRTGRVTYGFIHGNWALCNSRPDRRWCGVDHELPVLLETGCYADFTLPSAPSDTQTRTINSIYYARDHARGAKAHDRGTAARVGQTPPSESLLMVQGPLLLDWSHRKWGCLPRIENGDVHAHHRPSWSRFENWLRARIHVAGRPDWLFVKLHTHGAKDGNIDLWLSETMRAFHQTLARRAADSQLKHYYVTAWEMAQLVHQAERGHATPDWDALARPEPAALSAP